MMMLDISSRVENKIEENLFTIGNKWVTQMKGVGENIRDQI